jgi:hypothetical protein
MTSTTPEITITTDNPFPVVDYARGDLVDLGGAIAGRYVLGRHEVVVRHDESDEWRTLPLRAVHVDAAGPAVEVGPYSISPREAREVAAMLRHLADVADGLNQ